MLKKQTNFAQQKQLAKVVVPGRFPTSKVIVNDQYNFSELKKSPEFRILLCSSRNRHILKNKTTQEGR